MFAFQSLTPTPTRFMYIFGVFATAQLKPGWGLSEAALTSLMETRLMAGPRAHRPRGCRGQDCTFVQMYLPKKQAQLCRVPRPLFPAPPHSATPCRHSESPLTMGQRVLTCPCPRSRG